MDQRYLSTGLNREMHATHKRVSEIGRLKNSVIGYLKREGIYDSLPKSRDSFSHKRRQMIRSLKFNDNRDLVLGTMMDPDVS